MSVYLSFFLSFLTSIVQCNEFLYLLSILGVLFIFNLVFKLIW